MALDRALLGANRIWVGVCVAWVLAVALTAVGGWLLARDVQLEAAKSSARAYSTAVTAMRDQYITGVLVPVREANADADDLAQHPLELPLAYDLLGRVGEDAGTFRVVSDFPWSTSRIQSLSAVDRKILQEFESGTGRDEVTFRRGGGAVVFAEPIRMKESCVACHNADPTSPRTDWRVGDIRGAQIIELEVSKVPILPSSDSWVSVSTAAIPAVVLAALGFPLLRASHRAGVAVENAELFSTIVANSADPIISLDNSGRIVTFNPAAESLFGFDASEVVGETLRRMIRREDWPRHDAGVRRALVEGEAAIDASPIPTEVTALTKDGNEIEVAMTVSALEQVGPVRLVGVIRDLTETNRVNARLRESEKLEALGHLTAGVAHDFNNLLTVILSGAEAVGDLCTSGDSEAIVKDIIRSAENGAQLTNQLLAFTGQQSLRVDEIELQVFLERTMRLIERTLGEWLHPALRIPHDVWTIAVDCSQLETSILNVAINARDASIPNQGSFLIEARNRSVVTGDLGDLPAGDYVELNMRDTAGGIEPENLDRVFDPFYTTKERGKGSGLGLSSVQGFARQSGGDAWVRSTVGGGTTVTIVLPRAIDCSDEGEAS